MKRIKARTVEAFVAHLREREKSNATVEKYQRDVRCFLAFAGELISRQGVLDYKAMLGERYAVSGANSMIAAVNAYLRFCGRHDWCVKQFRLQRQIYRSEEKELTREEYERLVRAARERGDRRLALILQTICGTGIRVSELRHVTVEAAERGEAFVRCKGKNRHVFLVAKLRERLLRYARERGIVSGVIFVTRGGNPVSRHWVWREMKALCLQAGVLPNKVFPHNLRHLFARCFYEREKDIAKLADILGHSSINTTRIYIIATGAEHKRKLEHLHLII
ncbi:MAG: integrase [Ruminococcaceae bacterium]|nr:integrase [Oscillospiraceae bacterium]